LNLLPNQAGAACHNIVRHHLLGLMKDSRTTDFNRYIQYGVRTKSRWTKSRLENDQIGQNPACNFFGEKN
jgi:hypothetical protein